MPSTELIAVTPSYAPLSDPFEQYLVHVRAQPFLSEEEEREAALAWFEHHDRDAADRLLKAHLRLVVKVARRYRRQWPNLFDLVQEGNIGLIEALYRFDPHRQNRFGGYARYWIRAMILRFLLDNWSLIRVTNTRAGRKLFFQLHRERSELEAEGIVPTAARIAERSGITEAEVTAISQQLDNAVLTLDAPVGEGRTLSDVVSEEAPSPEANAARNELNALVHETMDRFGATLEGREKVVWEERLVAEDPTGLREIGERFGVTKQRVSQIESDLKRRLKKMLEADLGAEIELV